MAIVGRRLTGHSVGRDNRDLVLDIVTDDWHCRTGGIRPGLHRVRRGGVIDVAIATAIGINVGLGRRVARGIGPGLAHVQHAVRAERLRWSSECAEQWVADRHARERHVAGVLGLDRVVDHITDLVDRRAARRVVGVGDAVHRLGDVQRCILYHRHRRVVGVCGSVGTRRRRRVDDGGSGVELVLRHRMAGCVVPALAHIQQIVGVGVADIEAAYQHRRLVGRERIADHHPGDRRIAARHKIVCHRQRVVDDVAHFVGDAVGHRRILLNVQHLGLHLRHGGVVGVGDRGRVGVARFRVLVIASRDRNPVNMLLSSLAHWHRFGVGVDPGLAALQQLVSIPSPFVQRHPRRREQIHVIHSVPRRAVVVRE